MEFILLVVYLLFANGVYTNCPQQNILHAVPKHVLPQTPFHAINYVSVNSTVVEQHHKVHTINWLKNVNNISVDEVEKLKDEIVKYGVIKIPQQKMSPTDQMLFSEKLGEVVSLPQTSRANITHPEYPHRLLVSNYWNNGSWFESHHWHKDGDYFSFDEGYILSMFYAEQYDKEIIGGQTLFIDGCSIMKLLPKDIEENLRDATLSIDVRDIPDFAKISKEELAMLPEVHHRVIFRHPDKQEECVFLFLTIDDMNTSLKDAKALSMFRLWDFMQDPKHVIQQSWTEGDIVIWDNYGVFHRGMPFVKNGKKRILHRSQIRLNTRKKKHDA